MKVQYPILIEKGDENTAWGIVVPDLPGCFSAADHEHEILDNAREAILLHLEAISSIPEPSKLINIKPGKGFIISIVDVDLSTIEGPSKRINITIGSGLLAKIDAAAKASGQNRSAFLASAALHEMNRSSR